MCMYMYTVQCWVAAGFLQFSKNIPKPFHHVCGVLVGEVNTMWCCMSDVCCIGTCSIIK